MGCARFLFLHHDSVNAWLTTCTRMLKDNSFLGHPSLTLTLSVASVHAHRLLVAHAHAHS